MKGSSLQNSLKKLAEEQGADLFGIADLTSVQEYICDQGGESLHQFSRAISVGIRLLDSVVDKLCHHEDPFVVYAYTSLYTAVNARLNDITLLAAKRLQDYGYHAFPVPASHPFESSLLAGVISHKLVAHLAGLGWIGKSCLLITPEYGPRVRFSTILTDAPLKAGAPIDDGCKDCIECIRICPVHAFTGKSFDPSDKREARYNARLCDEYFYKRKDKFGEGLCGLCVYICPYGRRK